MKAVVMRGVSPAPILEEVDVDAPGPGEVLVRMGAAGVCGTDVHVFDHGAPAASLPMIMGHEGAGTVETVGEGVETVTVGDRVVITSTAPCGECLPCRRGSTYQCLAAQRGPAGNRTHVGGADLHPFAAIGSMAEYAVVRAGQLVPISDDVAFDVLALAGCGVMTGLGAVLNGTRPEPGGSVLVTGCGGVGLNVIQGAKLRGPRSSSRSILPRHGARLAITFGATHVFDPSVTDIAENVRRVAPGGVDMSYDAVGSEEVIAQSLAATRPGGICTMIGVPKSPSVSVPAGVFIPGERRLQGCMMGGGSPHRDIPEIVKLYLDGRILLDELVGERLPIESFHQGFEDAARGEIARCVLMFDRD